jgi:hypothetical protein
LEGPEAPGRRLHNYSIALRPIKRPDKNTWPYTPKNKNAEVEIHIKTGFTTEERNN